MQFNKYCSNLILNIRFYAKNHLFTQLFILLSKDIIVTFSPLICLFIKFIKRNNPETKRTNIITRSV